MSMNGGYHIFDLSNCDWSTAGNPAQYTTTIPGVYERFEAVRGYGKMTIVSGFSPTGAPFTDSISVLTTVSGNFVLTVTGGFILTLTITPEDNVTAVLSDTPTPTPSDPLYVTFDMSEFSWTEGSTANTYTATNTSLFEVLITASEDEKGVYITGLSVGGHNCPNRITYSSGNATSYGFNITEPVAPTGIKTWVVSVTPTGEVTCTYSEYGVT